jgi:DNA excision repair protein ERCC-5
MKELLQLFGIPYVLSPVEAEAQCAFLKQLDLVDGIVTDDSDVFLFGGDNVYRHMFHKDKPMEFYTMQKIKSELSIDRNKLIDLAILLGSDYSAGINGIGLVNAMEILSAFPGERGLSDFKKWIDSNQDTETDALKNLVIYDQHS